MTRKNFFLQRIENKRRLRRRYLIVCEGEIEQLYLRAINLENPNITTNIFVKPKDPIKIVENAIARISDATRNGISFDEVWCVFDKDLNTISNLKIAFKLAQKNRIKIAFSNPCLELWFLLHFKEVHNEISIKKILRELNAQLKHAYNKRELRDIENKTVPVLLKNEKKAVNHVKKIKVEKSDIPQNPYTSMLALVESLRK